MKKMILDKDYSKKRLGVRTFLNKGRCLETVKRKLKCPEKISLVQVCDTS